MPEPASSSTEVRRRAASRRQERTRRGLLTLTYVAVGVAAYGLVGATATMTTTVISSYPSVSVGAVAHGGRAAQVTITYQSWLNSDPVVVTFVLVAMGISLGVVTRRVLLRLRRHSTGVDRVSMLIGAIFVIVAVLGMLTVGALLVPFAVLVVTLATPMDRLTPVGPT